ncbi:MAG: hypothetical protein IKY02_02305 [Lachnospiraceae bacterium]|nr:hypothetical protein [Lachnospiraceae bacterium]
MSFQAGFARLAINPELGHPISGYYIKRNVEGYLDDVEVNALALKAEEEPVVFLSLDVCSMAASAADKLRDIVSEKTGLPKGRIAILCTHSHTAPYVSESEKESEIVRNYFVFLSEQLSKAVTLAIADLKPARAGWKTGSVPKISHCRRILMKDGSIKTNPGTGNPDAVREMTPVDERVNVLRFDQEGGYTILIANYGNHPDSIGGCKVSADFPGFFRRTFERAVPNTRCIFWNGCEGDINFIDVFAKDGDLNDTKVDFDDVIRGYDHSRYIGESLAGAVLQVHRKVNWFEPVLKVREKTAELPANVPTPEEAKEAHRINDLHKAGRDAEIPYRGMMLTTVVAEAARMVRLEHGPATTPVELTGMVLGPVAVLGIAGEAFTGVGLRLKADPKFSMVMPVVITNGSRGYFPMMDAYEEGGYEARASRFKAGVAERIAEEGQELLYTLLEE